MPETIDLPKLKKPFGKLYESDESLEYHLMAIEAHQEKIGDIIKSTQQNCKHKGGHKKEFARPEKRERALVSKICEECGFSLPQPKGEPWQICTKCWEPMEHKEGQPPHIYHCTGCGHPALK